MDLHFGFREAQIRAQIRHKDLWMGIRPYVAESSPDARTARRPPRTARRPLRPSRGVVCWWRWGRVELPVQNPSPGSTTSVSDDLSSTARTNIGTLPGGPVTFP